MNLLSLTKTNGKASKEHGTPTIYRTNDYSKFQILDSNRSVNEKHVRRLMDSFKTNYLFTVITVNKDMQIIDGQHRFTAASRLSLPIYYTIIDDYGVKEVQALNTNQVNWKKMDYLHSFCSEGKPAYLELQDFMKAFPDFGIRIATRLLTGLAMGSKSGSGDDRGDSLKDFENGKLKLGNVGKAYVNARKIMEFKDFYSGYNRSTFVGAILPLFGKSCYDHKRMMHKIKTANIRLDHCANVEQYRLLLQKIYNFKASADDRSDFINV